MPGPRIDSTTCRPTFARDGIIRLCSRTSETAIPPAVMRDAKGLAILTMTKAGYIVSGRGGTGIGIARTESTSRPNDPVHVQIEIRSTIFRVTFLCLRS